MLESDSRAQLYARTISGDLCAAVGAQDLVVEMLDAKAQARDADLLDRLKFRLLERARLTFEGDFLGRVPGPLLVDLSISRRSCALLRNDGVPPPK